MSKQNPPIAQPKRTYEVPYLWRATLRTGQVLVRGDRLEGKIVLSPINIPEGELQKLELLPALEHDKWPKLEVTLAKNERLEYAMTREGSTSVGLKVISEDAYFAA